MNESKRSSGAPVSGSGSAKQGAKQTLSGTRHRAWRAGAGVALALGLLGAANDARAQSRTFYLDRLPLAGAPDDGIAIWRPEWVDKTRFFGQLGLGFALNPFRLEDMIADPDQRARAAQHLGTPVGSQLITYADVGVEFLHRFSVQVEAPFVLYEGTSTTSDPSVAAARTSVGSGSAAVGDFRLDARAVLWTNDTKTLKVAAGAAVYLPTGDATSYAGDGATGTGLYLAGEYDAKSAFFTLNTGFHFRAGSAVNDFKVGDEWTWGLGAFLPMRGNSLRLGAEVFGSTGIANGTTFTKANTPLEWMLEGRLWTDQKRAGYVALGAGTRLDAAYAPDFRVIGLVGYSFSIADTAPPAPGKKFKERWADHGADTDHDGIPDDVDLCPTEPEDHKGPNPDDGCPSLPDRDGDGIPDVDDKCPDQPEDFDGIQDADGCPEDDADKDGIPDAQDACPKEPGEPDPDPKQNGCPKFIRRIKGSSEIELLKNIEFETGKATILKKSYPIVDEVVRLMKVNLDIKFLDIEGHTDNKGSDELNEKLSNDRANSVMRYLIEHGIDAGRLTAKGYGPKRPIADNNTADGRQRNRRVEFHIRGQAVQQPQKPSPAETPPKDDAPPPATPPAP